MLLKNVVRWCFILYNLLLIWFSSLATYAGVHSDTDLQFHLLSLAIGTVAIGWLLINILSIYPSKRKTIILARLLNAIAVGLAIYFLWTIRDDVVEHSITAALLFSVPLFSFFVLRITKAPVEDKGGRCKRGK